MEGGSLPWLGLTCSLHDSTQEEGAEVKAYAPLLLIATEYLQRERERGIGH